MRELLLAVRKRAPDQPPPQVTHTLPPAPLTAPSPRHTFLIWQVVLQLDDPSMVYGLELGIDPLVIPKLTVLPSLICEVCRPRPRATCHMRKVRHPRGRYFIRPPTGRASSGWHRRTRRRARCYVAYDGSRSRRRHVAKGRLSTGPAPSPPRTPPPPRVGSLHRLIECATRQRTRHAGTPHSTRFMNRKVCSRARGTRVRPPDGPTMTSSSSRVRPARRRRPHHL